MRDLLSKMTTGSMVVAAALLVSACGGTESASTVDNTVTDMNAMEPMDGTVTDNMTDVDGAMGNDALANDAMANDAAANDSATANEATANEAAAQ